MNLFDTDEVSRRIAQLEQDNLRLSAQFNFNSGQIVLYKELLKAIENEKKQKGVDRIRNMLSVRDGVNGHSVANQLRGENDS